MKYLKQRIFQILEKAEDGDRLSRIFDIFILILILMNVLAVILASFPDFSFNHSRLLDIFEIISVTIFTIEIVLRFYTSSLKYPEYSKAKAFFKYAFSVMALIDLFAILPFYLPLIIPIDLRFIRILRITRILRILKVNRYSSSLDLIGRVLNKKKYELFITLFITSLLLLLASSIMYYLENGAQPDSFPNIIASFWWAIATLTTVGYGDVYPVTVLGKIVSGIIALLGIGIVALPTGIISSGFMEILDEENEDKRSPDIKYCPHCGGFLKK